MPTTTILSDLMRPALRMAGITLRPGIIPSTDQFAELIPEVNRMLQSWNCDGQKIFSTSIEQFTLVDGQKIYSIGPGGDFDTTRPQFIRDANLIFPTNPQLRTPLKLLDEHEWSLIRMQDIGNSLPWCLFYNPTYGATGRGTIYMAFQPPEGYLLELYTWKLLGNDFTAITDLVILPDGYNDAIVTNLAIRAASLYPTMATIGPDTRKLAANALDRLQTLNTVCPTLRSEAEYLGIGGNWQWTGMFATGGGTSDVSVKQITIDGTITGTTGLDGNPTFTLEQLPVAGQFFQLFNNGSVLTSGTQYTRSNQTITFVSPYIPVVGDLLAAYGVVAN